MQMVLWAFSKTKLDKKNNTIKKTITFNHGLTMVNNSL